MRSLSTLQLSRYLSVTKRTIQRRAIKEDWPYHEKIGLGGTKRVYTFATLPDQVKAKVIASIIAGHEQYHLGVVDEQSSGQAEEPFLMPQMEADLAVWLNQHCFAHSMEQSNLNKGYVKLGLLNLARLFVDSLALGKIKGFDRFCKQYNERELELDRAVYSVIKRVSRITLLRWEKREQELAAPSPKVVVSNNGRLFDTELRAMAEEVLMVSPGISARRLRQHFLTFFGDKKIPNERLIHRWINQGRV